MGSTPDVTLGYVSESDEPAAPAIDLLELPETDAVRQFAGTVTDTPQSPFSRAGTVGLNSTQPTESFRAITAAKVPPTMPKKDAPRI